MNVEAFLLVLGFPSVVYVGYGVAKMLEVRSSLVTPRTAFAVSSLVTACVCVAVCMCACVHVRVFTCV